jgi:hypothetical protein
MSYIVDGQLRGPEGREVVVRISSEADTLCAPCPHRRGLGCEYQGKIVDLDRRHAEALDLEAGQILTWGDCLDRVVDRVTPPDLDVICAGCRWLDLGLCKQGLANLLDERKTPPPEERRVG